MDDGKPVRGGDIPLKYVAWLTPVLLLVLLGGSILFYKERMLYIDAPHILFKLINEGHIWIEQGRCGAFISQLLPLMGVKLHLPLLWLMMLYSASFYMFYFVVSLLLVCYFRNYGLAVLLGLYFTVFVSATYYWPNNEVHQGIVWLLLAFAVSFCIGTWVRHKIIGVLLFTGIFYLAIWTHPLVMFAAVYLWFFYMADKTRWPYTKRQSFVFSIILLALCYIKFYMGLHDWYDSSKIESVTHFQLSRLMTVFSSPQMHFFVRSCMHGYWLFTLLFISGLAGLLYARKYAMLLWTLLFAGGYVMLVCITFRDVPLLFYTESEYMPLVIICCAPFVYYVLPKIRPGYAVGLFVFIYALRMICIYNAALPFTSRVTIMGKINERMGAKGLTKVIIAEPVPDIDSMLIMNWGAPVESIYISALKGENPQRTFIFLKPDEIKASDTTSLDVLIGCFERRNVSRINRYYFQIDTTVAYKVMTYKELMR